jgi:hypothetical protein
VLCDAFIIDYRTVVKVQLYNTAGQGLSAPCLVHIMPDIVPFVLRCTRLAGGGDRFSMHLYGG